MKISSEKTSSDMKIALIHDWLNGMRGGEKVLLELCRLYPKADIFTLLHEPGKVDAEIESHTIHTSFIQKLPGVKKHYRNYLPLFPIAIERFDLRDFDLVISTSHCVAKGVITRPDAMHFSYIHSPMRYIWDMHYAYFPSGVGNIAKRILYRSLSTYLRMWDITSNYRVDYFIANSTFVAQRIHKYYRRESHVIHPPVDVEKYQVTANGVGDYFLVFSSLVPYKRVDLAINVFNELNLPLIVVGKGPEKAHLQAIAKSNIEFKDWLSDADLVHMLAGARALIFPGLEDFGIIPVEANASGVPVIAFGKGGVLDSLVPLHNSKDKSPTGLFFNEQTERSLTHAVEEFIQNEQLFADRNAIRAHTMPFSSTQFKNNIKAFIASKMDAGSNGQFPTHNNLEIQQQSFSQN